MANDPTILDLATAQRMAAATRRVERQPQFRESADYGDAPADDDSGLFPVTVAMTTGSAGSATTACGFQYTVTDVFGGGTLGTGLAPIWARPSLGKMVQATHGTGYYDSAGEFVLYQVDEVPATAGRGCA